MDPAYHNCRGAAAAGLEGDITGDLAVYPLRKYKTFILANFDTTFEIVTRFGIGKITQGKGFGFIQIRFMNNDCVLWFFFSFYPGAKRYSQCNYRQTQVVLMFTKKTNASGSTYFQSLDRLKAETAPMLQISSAEFVSP